MTKGAVDVRAWMHETSERVSADADHLTALDAAIGDGDHGYNLDRGFREVVAALDDAPELGVPESLALVGRTMTSKGGGASGVLWGAFFQAAGREASRADVVDITALARAIDAGTSALQKLGAASVGDKTMLDALAAAGAELQRALADELSPAAALAQAAEAAEAAALATVPLRARRGRAAYLGERSIGHEDPGAASAAIVVRALARSADR